MLTFSKIRLAAAVLALSGATAQADDLLEQLSAAPPQFVETISESASPSNEAVQPVSYSLFDGEAASCCESGTCGTDCSCGCAPESQCLLSQVFGTVADLIPGTDLKSDRCFDRFIEPVTNSVYFEDPRSRTRLRALFINQTVPQSTPVVGDSDFQVYGLEATFAINERFSIIAQKDGWINLQSAGLGNQGGWANLATGVKYVIVRDVENQFLLSGGLNYEWSNGSSNVLQGQGDGVWTPFLSMGKEFNCDTHFVAATGWHLPGDSADSSSFYYSLHLDHAVTEKAYALIELNGLHYIDDGNRIATPFEGGDLINLGSTQAEGFYLLTMAFGGTYKINRNWEAAGAYEIPLAAKGDIFDDRLTMTLSFIY